MPEPVAEDCQQQVERGEEDEDLVGWTGMCIN